MFDHDSPDDPSQAVIDSQADPPEDLAQLEFERPSRRSAQSPTQAAAPRRPRKRLAFSASLTPLLEAVVVWVTDPRWWSWLGGPSANARGGRRRPLPLPLPTVAAPENRPIVPPPVCRPEHDEQFLPRVLWARLLAWLRTRGRFHVISTVAHALAIIILGLLAGSFRASAPNYGTILDAAMADAMPRDQVARFNLGDAPLDPTVLDTAALEQTEPAAQLEQINDDSPVFEERGGGQTADSRENLGGMGGFDVSAMGTGPAVAGPGGVGTGVGADGEAGSGGAGSGFGGRGAGMREALAGAFGGTRQTERAVAAALNWMARHQNSDGSWSLDEFSRHCKDKTCTGAGEIKSDAAATAMALLPFLAAGQTHESKGPYQKTIRGGLNWLVNHQQTDGSLAGSGNYSLMYTHGLAAIAVCEAYGLTKDSRLGAAAQHAVRFIEKGQHTAGGWRYTPGQSGDTSVTGWQVMALKSAQMAGLKVDPATLAGAKEYLLSVASGSAGNEFAYLKGDEPSLTMTAVGLLCSQYLGASRQDAIMGKGMTYLARHRPAENERDCYYWYYGTQVMHNLPGPEWDAWNRQLRRLLIKSQIKEGCATGSWDPVKPTTDLWGRRGGRLMQTSLSALSIEVYYRYLPLYRLDGTPGSADAHTASLPPTGAANEAGN